MILHEIPIIALLDEERATVHCTSVDSTVYAAVLEMNRQHIGSLLVKNADHVVGIFTERDVLTRVVVAGLEPKSTLVHEVMTQKFEFINEDASVEDAMQIMLEARVRHLPVFDGDELLGMLSIGDINNWLLKMNEIEAENLRRYMFEGYPA